MPAGRPVKPIEQKKLQGTARKDRMPINPIKPMMLDKVPRPAEMILSKVAKRKWNELCQILLSEGRLHVPDLIWIEMMCLAYDKMNYSFQKIYDSKKDNYFDEIVIEQVNQGGQNYQSISAWEKEYISAKNEYAKAAIELGLSARIRGSINGGAGTATNPLRALMSGQNN
jgi:phage terminase small subunit